MSKSVVVTGGAGFIGSHLVDRCLERGWDVTVIDDLSIGDRRNMQSFRSDVQFHKVDVRSNSLEKHIEGADLIFHQAALPSVPRSFSSPVKSTDINILGTVNLFQAADQVGADRVVFASSSSVYGDKPELPKVETMSPDPQSPYAASKQSKEIFGRVYSEQFDLDVIGLRYFNVFGPRQNPNSDYAAVIPNFIQALLNGEQPVIYGDGEQSRDFTFVKDVVKANMLAAESAQPGTVYNVGYNQQMTINDLLYELRRITGSQIDPRYEAPRPGDVRHSRADSERLREDAGFEPDYEVEQGLRKTVEWFENNHDRWKDGE
ncbi:MAG: SDR family oxidoreductase [bacterium]